MNTYCGDLDDSGGRNEYSMTSNSWILGASGKCGLRFFFFFFFFFRYVRRSLPSDLLLIFIFAYVYLCVEVETSRRRDYGWDVLMYWVYSLEI